MKILKDVDLAQFTTIRIGGKGKFLAVSQTVEDLRNVIHFSREKNLPLFVLGKGANTIFGDVNGVIVNLSKFKCKPTIIKLKDGIRVHIHSGNSLSDLINISIEFNAGDIFRLYGFPATVGGAIAMNAGAYGYEIKDELISIKFLDWDGNIEEIQKNEIGFDYRRSPFPQKGIILEAVFFFKYKDLNVKEHIISIKEKRLSTQPIQEYTSGSTFKNPHEAPAGYLLEKYGLKGLREGNVMFSQKHANFLINLGEGTIYEVKKLINIAKNRIFEETGIILQEEVKLIEDSGLNGWKIL